MRIYISYFHQEHESQLTELVSNVPEGHDVREIVKMELVNNLHSANALISEIIRNDHTYEELTNNTRVVLTLVKNNLNGHEMYVMNASVETTNWGYLHCVGLVHVYY